MNIFTNVEKQEALRVVESTIQNCEKIHPKFAEGTSQHSLLRNRIKALVISKALITDDPVLEQFTLEEVRTALKPIESIISKCETGQRKHEKGATQYKRFQKTIDAMTICKILIEDKIKTG